MKIGIYPGSFNPWHEGHDDVMSKALQVFDKIVVAVGQNENKEPRSLQDLDKLWGQVVNRIGVEESHKVSVTEFKGLLAEFSMNYFNNDDYNFLKASAVIRGLRNGQDFEYEKTQQYWNEDLGLEIPTVYFIADRGLTHISSSTVRNVNKIKGL